MPIDAKKETPLVIEFFEEFETFVKSFVASADKSAEDEDERGVVQSLGPTLISQIAELKAYVIERSERASSAQRQEADVALRMSSGVQLAKNSKGLLGNIRSFIGSLGIGKIFEEIKKIVRLLFEAFGWSIPKWLNTLFTLIDEIAEAILGAKSPKLATALSRQAQNYLGELTQLERLKAVKADGFDDDDMDE